TVVRSDEEALGDKIAKSKAWDRRDPLFRKVLHIIDGPDGQKVGRAHPFSAHERNAFFMNGGFGKSFHKLSGLSGVDSPLDSRGFALLDFDRDGDQDMALINANAPSFELYRTEVPTKGNFIAIQLTGGADGRYGLSNRDAIGTRIRAKTVKGRWILRTLAAGEGFGIQNSKMVLIGIGDEDLVSEIELHWPTGQVFRLDQPVQAGKVVHFEEREKTTDWKISEY
ncbi:ASPIC/UnbV domain-containing protein, partial [Akkermansiaceae bacterium]|nr:ASPIC/UnbV domain-containing protein [Akkermansiaceae bacterium]